MTEHDQPASQAITMSSRSLRSEPPALAPVGRTICITSDGTVTVHRDHGCSPDDVRDLCEALISGELQVVDLTELGPLARGRASPTSIPARAACSPGVTGRP
jgi:hypothetical protein